MSFRTGCRLSCNRHHEIFVNLAVKDLDRSVEFLDLGFMYGRSFNDPDGHLWEVFWMDPSALEQQPETAERLTT